MEADLITNYICKKYLYAWLAMETDLIKINICKNTLCEAMEADFIKIYICKKNFTRSDGGRFNQNLHL
jgi:hypothetical protein